MSARATRSKAGVRSTSAVKASKVENQSKYWSPKAATRKGKKRAATVEEDTAESDDDVDAYKDEKDASEVESLHSDALDEDDFDAPASGGKKRKRVSSSLKKSPAKKTYTRKAPAKKASTSTRKKRKTAKDSEDADEDDLELEDGQEVVGVVVQAPKTGRVPPGQISKNTLDFLSQLKKPECNDREWYELAFLLNKPVYRLAESEWKAFVDQFTDSLVEVDPQIPHLPPKDVIHRIYRDIRFSNDKTPYKTGFSASFSRSGRKGIFAGCECMRPTLDVQKVKSGNESLIAAGTWCPGKNELQTIRNNLLRSSRRLRRIISAPEFEALFGPARPHPKGQRQNVFGFEDELKVAPKGIDKTHKDIDLLKCRSFAVLHKFTDKQVLSPEFRDELASVVKVMRPFVHCLNDLMTIQNADSSSSDDGNQSDDAADEDEDEDENEEQ
ncbi:hypothetical protein BD413DRAFT_603800 [Trametes elegans]|nr:hypothetical protein BD413DRAFT_603800 [Trametes elegans]